MRRSALPPVVLCFVLAASLESAFAVDQPISGAKLDVKRQGTKQQLSFTSKDPAFLFPGIGSADDPGTGAPGGALIEILSAVEPTVTFTVPTGVGKPGWASKPGTIPKHVYTNPLAPSGPTPVKKVTLRQGKVLELTSKDAGLALTMATTRVAIRITIGTLRNCAVFDGATIRKNEPGRLTATKAPAPAIGDCTDASLLGITVMCGASAPACNGECPPGEECASYGLDPPNNNCGCLPIGSTPCGTPSVPTCGGSCPNGGVCGAIFAQSGYDCSCGVGCGNGFAYGGAPQEGFPFGCYPLLCGGSYPTCGGPCLDGGTCSAFEAGGSFTGCICAVAMPCTAGGYDCPVGEVCRVNGLNVGCGPP